MALGDEATLNLEASRDCNEQMMNRSAPITSDELPQPALETGISPTATGIRFRVASCREANRQVGVGALASPW